ncbi:MAG: YciI family protein [Candidatus Angelobacter sp.]
MEKFLLLSNLASLDRHIDGNTVPEVEPAPKIEINLGETAMRFLSIYKTVERNVPPSQDEMDRMGKLIEEGTKAGWLLGTEGCLPTALGARVRRANGKINVTDGPFTEAKEVVGGFAILKANSREEAIELTRTFLQNAGDGECELRQLYEQ